MPARLQLLPALAALTLSAHAGIEGQSADTTDLESVVTAMAKVGAAWSPSFSPRGDRIAFVTRLSGTPQLWTVARRKWGEHRQEWAGMHATVVRPLGEWVRRSG
jgi:hypothetical protein